MVGHRKTKILLGVGIFALFCVSASVWARPMEESEHMAASGLGEKIAGWVRSLPNAPESVLIYSVDSHEPFDKAFSDLLETQLIKYFAENDIREVTVCLECRIAQVRVEQSNVIVSKGAPDTETIKRMASRFPTKSALLVDVHRTNLHIKSHAVLYSNPDGKLIGAKDFDVPIVEVSEKSVQFMLTFGSGLSGFSAATTTATGLRWAANIALLEEVGFAKAGLNIGAIMVPGTQFFHLSPTLGFRGRFGASKLRWGFDLGLGYGLQGSRQGFAVRGAPQLFVGSFAVIGAEVTYFLPNDGNTTTYMQYYTGLHIGIAIGG